MQYVLFRCGGLGLLFGAFILAYCIAAEGGPGTISRSNLGADRDGDPLPSGATGRLGTIRWRYPSPVELVQFSDKGKQFLACCGDGVIRVSEATTGKEIRHFGHKDGCLETVTADGAKIAQATADGRVHIWDVGTGKESHSFDLGFQDKLKGAKGLSFVKGDQFVAWGMQHTIKLWDIGTGRLLRVLLDDATKEHGEILQLAVSPDGSTLAFTTSDVAINIWSLKDGKPRKALKVAGLWNDVQYTSPVFSPDSRYVAWPEPDGTIQLYQSATLEKVRKLGEASKDGRVEGASFSADGKTLAAVTRRQMIRLLDVATGRLLREIGEEVPRYQGRRSMSVLHNSTLSLGAVRLDWSPNSKVIVQAWGPGIIRIWDTMTGKGNDLSIAHVGAITGLIVSVDGNFAFTLGQDNTVRTWEIATVKEKRRVSLPPDTTFGNLLAPNQALLCTKEDSLSVWDIEKEKYLVQVALDKNVRLDRYDVSRDGKSLFAVELQGFQVTMARNARLYKLDTGAECQGFAANWTKQRKGEEAKLLGDDEGLVSLTQASKGQPVVATISVSTAVGGFGSGDRYLLRCKQSEKDTALVWETKETEFEGICRAVSFTPDDRAILTFNLNRKPWKTWICLHESTTGRERCRFELPVDVNAEAPYLHAFSRNGDLLAVPTAKGTTVIDIRLGKEIANLNGEQGSVGSLAFGADMATLFTSGSDGTVLIWDISEHIRKARQFVNISPADAKRLWTELGDTDTPKAYRAVAAIVMSPTQGLRVLHEQLKPVVKTPTAEIEKLIADLNNPKFKTREQAVAELRRIGPQAKAALQKSLERKESLEHYQRVGALLVELEQREAVPSQDELRELRAIEVLEVIGSAPAQSILSSLAKGASGLRVTDEAVAVLGRNGLRIKK